MSKSQKAFQFTLLYSALFFSLSPVMAATADNPKAMDTDEPSANLETIKVVAKRNATRYNYLPDNAQTATKTATDITKTPQSLSVVTRRQLDERTPNDVTETLAYTSGVSGGYRGENTVIETSVRGIGNKSSGGSNTLFLNGARYEPALEMNPYVIDKIEVLKGPASVLYGQAAPGGLVNIITKKATGSNEREVMLKTGSGSRKEIGVDLDNKLSASLAYRLVAAAKYMDWQAGDFVEQESYSVAPSLKWQPSDATTLVLSGLYENQPKAGDRNFLLRKGLIDPVDGKFVPFDFFPSDPNFHDLHNKKSQLGYELTHNISDQLSFQQSLNVAHFEDYLKTLLVWDPSSGSEMIRKARIFDDKTDLRQVDSRLNWQPKTSFGDHHVLLGLDYFNKKYQEEGYSGVAPSIDWQNPAYGVSVANPNKTSETSTKSDQLGVYLQDQVRMDQLNLLLGGRFDKTKAKFDNKLTDKQEDYSDHAFTWRAGALYELDNNLSPYVSYSTSFVPELGTDSQGKALHATKARQAEFGLKYQPNPFVLLTGAIFDIEQDNLTVRDPVTFEKSQIGEIRTRGGEIEVQGDITDNWGVSGSYTLLDKQITEDKNVNLIGKTQWGVARNSAALWSDYRFDDRLQGLSVGAGLRYVGKTWGDNNNTFEVPSYTLWDLKVGFDPEALMPKLKGTHFQLNVQNVGDKHYVASCAHNAACFYGKERQFVVSASKRW